MLFLCKFCVLKITKYLFLIFTLVVFRVLSQSTPLFDGAAITKILYQHANDDSPGMAVGVVKDGEIIYEHYLGYANMEHKVKVNDSTRFNIASNAKQFTALCILKLINEGKIHLNDDFRLYLPDFYKSIEDEITISNLLTHTSGIRDYCDLYALKGKTWWKQFMDNADAIELLQSQKDLNFNPGTEYLYSNSNYILLTEIIKKVTDQNFSDYAKTMFEELDMANTHFLTNYMSIIPHKARPYGNWNGWQEEPTITEVHGDGALFTTLADQLKWEQIIQINSGEYYSQNLINESQSPLESSIDNSYGYGLEFDIKKGFNYTFHNGSTAAYNATFLRFPAKSISLVVMSNNRSVPSNYLAWQIATLVLGFESEEEDGKIYQSNPDKIEKLNELQDVLGVYKNESEDGKVISITEKDGALYREIYQRDPAKLVNKKDGLFEYEEIKGLKMNFTNIGKTEQNFTLYKSSQKPSIYYKKPNLNSEKNELDGRFYNDETNTAIILKFVEGNTYTLTKNGKERQAKLILKDYLRMMSSYKIKVIRDKENNVTGLNVENNGIKNVMFVKIGQVK